MNFQETKFLFYFFIAFSVFLWGHLKNVVYADPSINIQVLKNKITHACNLLNENQILAATNTHEC